jgi:hypothetical protein
MTKISAPAYNSPSSESGLAQRPIIGQRISATAGERFLAQLGTTPGNGYYGQPEGESHA